MYLYFYYCKVFTFKQSKKDTALQKGFIIFFLWKESCNSQAVFYLWYFNADVFGAWDQWQCTVYKNRSHYLTEHEFDSYEHDKHNTSRHKKIPEIYFLMGNLSTIWSNCFSVCIFCRCTYDYTIWISCIILSIWTELDKTF